MNNCLLVKLLSKNARMPERASLKSAGLDISSAEKVVLCAGTRAVIKTDLSVACPEGTYARMAPRSGLARQMIDCQAGVIDGDYRGNVCVILHNCGENDFYIDVGDRIAQLILEQISMVPAIEVEDLNETIRGSEGFGSTGGFSKLIKYHPG